jgi:hypothetical protein
MATLQPKKQFLNMEDRLFQDKLHLKEQKREINRECIALRIKSRGQEIELHRKDDLIRKLVAELK